MKCTYKIISQKKIPFELKFFFLPGKKSQCLEKFTQPLHPTKPKFFSLSLNFLHFFNNQRIIFKTKLYRFSPFFSHVQIDFSPDDDKFDDLCTFKKRYALSKKKSEFYPPNLHFYLIQASCLVMKKHV